MTFEDKFAQFNLTLEDIERFQLIAKLHENENCLARPFIIKTEVINMQANDLEKITK